jgi:hypothetical protein
MRGLLLQLKRANDRLKAALRSKYPSEEDQRALGIYEPPKLFP